MFIKPSIALLVLSTLIALPMGIARADIDIQSGDVRVRVGNGVQIDSNHGNSVFLPGHRPSAIDRYRVWRNQRPMIWNQSQIDRALNCTGDSYENTESQNSGSGTSRTYTSMSTRVCH